MNERRSLWDAVKRETENYQFVADAYAQPKWEVSRHIAINVAVSGRFSANDSTAKHPTTISDYVDAASSVIEAGACGVHIDFTFVTDDKGRRLDRDLPPVEAYTAVLTPLRARFGSSFVANLNVLNGSSFTQCMSPAQARLAEVAPCAPGHPEEFVTPAIQVLEECGVKPELAVHSSGEIELAKRRLIDTGILKKPYYWIILYGLPFDAGRTLISGTWVPNAQDMARHMFQMVDQIRRIDPSSVITVCAAGRATLYLTTLATMMGLQIRVGTEDTPFKFPNSDERLRDNLEMFSMARDIAQLLGRSPATAQEYRAMLGLDAPSI